MTSRRLLALALSGADSSIVAGCGDGGTTQTANSSDAALIAQGKDIFRFDTFGDEAHWTDVLRLHEIVGKTPPVAALILGLKVDSEALPAFVVQGIQKKSIDLANPATTVALIKLNAVAGLKGKVESINGTDTLTRLGVTFALCHSTVDNSFSKALGLPYGIGKRLDGWPNRDLNPGAIISLSPAVDAAKKLVYLSWGKGKYDPRFNLDGQNGPQVIRPAYGLKDIHRITSTGDGEDLSYWTRYVGVTQMGGHGSFSDPRIGTTGVNVTNGTDDMISSKLAALQAYQLSLSAPPAPSNSFDVAAADRGKIIFNAGGTCATCHAGTEFTDANTRLHPVSDAVSEPEPNGAPSYASRSATKQYRTAPLKGLWQHAPYFHNGSAPTLDAVIRTYNTKRSLGLRENEITDLTEYLKSL